MHTLTLTTRSLMLPWLCSSLRTDSAEGLIALGWHLSLYKIVLRHFTSGDDTRPQLYYVWGRNSSLCIYSATLFPAPTHAALGHKPLISCE